MVTVILGWGSLIWDECPTFDRYIGEWYDDGPTLKLEFSRISRGKRRGALTLVIDKENGTDCTVLYARSTRKNPRDAICDLRGREGTILKRVGYYVVDSGESGEPEVPANIRKWAREMGIDMVVWTGLESNFSDANQEGRPFSVPDAISYLRVLPPAGRKAAIEYVSKAPKTVDTPLRRTLQSEPGFGEV